MDNLMKNESFCNGITVGINLYQNRVITAHKQKKPLVIGDTLYYLQDGRERLLEELLDRICD